MNNFEPTIVAFCCHFCAYTAADLAGTMRLQYPPNIRIVRIPCTGKVDVRFLLEAFEKGADGVKFARCRLFCIVIEDEFCNKSVNIFFFYIPNICFILCSKKAYKLFKIFFIRNNRECRFALTFKVFNKIVDKRMGNIIYHNSL